MNMIKKLVICVLFLLYTSVFAGGGLEAKKIKYVAFQSGGFFLYADGG